MHNLRARCGNVPLATVSLAPFHKLKWLWCFLSVTWGQFNLPKLLKDELHLFNHKLKLYSSFQIRNNTNYISAGQKDLPALA